MNLFILFREIDEIVTAYLGTDFKNIRKFDVM